MKFRQQYADPKADELLGKESALVFLPEEDMTVQEHAVDCDINVMMKRFGVTGSIRTIDKQALFGDFTEATDFQTALNLVKNAEREFLNLPSELRNELRNDPSRLPEWLSDEANRDRALQLGLVDRPQVVEPIPVRVLPDVEG